MQSNFANLYSFSGIYGTFCQPCSINRNAKNLHNDGIIWGILGCFLPCYPIILLRRQARQRYEIQGSNFDDILSGIFCHSCVNCQIASEIKANDDDLDDLAQIIED